MMGEPTFWMRIQNLVIEIRAKYRCWRGWHVYLSFNSNSVCHWCGKLFKTWEILDD